MKRILSVAQLHINPAWILTLGLFAMAPVLIVRLHFSQTHAPEGLYLAIGLFCALLAVAVTYVFSRGMVMLHRGIMAAKEGNLGPIKPVPALRILFGPVIEDYNVLVSSIASLFKDMEKSQASIISERNRNDAILRSLPGALMTVDGNFQVTLSNKLAEDLFGLPAAELLGQNIFELLQLNDDGRDLLREAFLYEQQINNKEIILSNGNRSRYYTLNLTFFLEAKNSADYSAAVMLQDVTDFKYMQELVHRSEKYLAIGQLAGGVAHELNTPLGTIVGYAQLLNEGVPSEERRLEYAQRIYREAKRCSHIIENLRAVAQRDVCRTETCNIDAVIGDVVDTVGNCPSKTHRARIETMLGCDRSVQGGPGQLDIVLVNIIMNAVQAATADSSDPLVTITSAVEDGHALVSITDNGAGVPAAQRGLVFDPFFTTKTGGAGIGLGLAISQSIVTRIGGSLSCDAEYSNGARFVLTVPLVEAQGA